MQTALAPTTTLPNDRYAVVLNANAGSVTPRLTRRLERIVSKDRLHLTESPDHAAEVLARCVEDEVHTVFAGGGDGTIVGVINTLAHLRDDRGAETVPDVGVLRLGTGNALARWLGSGRPARDLRRWEAGHVHRNVPVQMVEADRRLFPFAGLGYDAAIVNDYLAVKQAARGTWWEGLAKGIRGYVLSSYLKTLPHYLRRPHPRVRITNVGGPAMRIGPDGRPTGAPIPHGGLLYEGPASFVGAATTPLYGYGMTMFPHATARAGRMQLRVTDMSALQVAMNVVPLWNGKLAHPQLYDYWADRVRVVADAAMPFQMGGDPEGYRREVVFGVNRVPVHLVGQA